MLTASLTASKSPSLPSSKPQRKPVAKAKSSAPSKRIVGASELTLPTKQQLKRLSLRGMLALSARCVRRVQSLYSSQHPGAERAIEAGVQAAEAYAAGRTPQVVLAELRFATKFARNQGSRFVATAATYLAEAALLAARGGDVEDGHLATYRAWLAIASAYNADPDLSFVFTALDDFERLVVLCDESFPEAGAPIDAGKEGDLGPLWTCAE